MPSLALVALLSGALLTGSLDGDHGKDKSSTQAPQPAPSMIQASATPAGPRAITNDTYAFGRPSDVAPIKAWVSYGWGEAEAPNFMANGDEVPDALDVGDIQSQRVIVGAQINVLNFPAFKVGIGGQLVAGSNKVQLTGGTTELESGFGLQNVKPFVSLRGRVVGVHAGYFFDLADEVDPTDPTDLALSDERNALQLGADFDYPSERWRLFGGIDYLLRQDDDNAPPGITGEDDILWWNMGAGVRFSFVELGAALMIRTSLNRGEAVGLPGTTLSGGHLGSIAPYLKLSPPSIPVSLFVKGAVVDEYNDLGFALGGANDYKPSMGFTAGLTLGFE